MLSLKNKILTATAIGLLSMGGAVATASAQQGGYPPQAQQQQANVTDAQLQKFADAQRSVSTLQTEFMGQAQGVESPEEIQALQERANEKMIETIESSDLSVQEYNQIANLVQADQQVRERYMQLAQ